MSSSYNPSSQSPQDAILVIKEEIEFQTVLLESLGDEVVDNPEEAMQVVRDEIEALRAQLNKLVGLKQEKTAASKSRQPSKAASLSRSDIQKDAGQKHNGLTAPADMPSDLGMD